MAKCNYCSKKEGTFQVKDWSTGDISYYCSDHYQLAKRFNMEQENAFYEYYKNESIRTWLNEKQLLLWQRIDQRKNKRY